jgi:phage terminase small subunit
MGRPAKPAALKKLEGKRSHARKTEAKRAPAGKVKMRRARKITPAAPEAVEEKPQYELALRKIETEEFKRIAPHIEAVGEMSPLYATAIEDRCRVYARVVLMEGLIWSLGPLVEGRNRGGGMVKNPLFSELKAYRIALQKYDELLGLAPGPRGRIGSPEPNDDDDPEGLLG